MDDNPEPFDRRNKIRFVADQFKQFLGDQVQRKKRSLVEYIGCTCHLNREQPPPPPPNGVDPNANLFPAAVNGADPDAIMVNRDDPAGRISPALENRVDADAKIVNRDDPTGRIPPASEKEGNPNAEMANGGDPIIGIQPAPVNEADPDAAMENGDNPVGRIPPAPENRVDPEAEIGNGGDPVDGIPPPLANEADPDAVIVNDDNPVVGIPLEPANRVNPGEEMPADMREYITERMRGYRVQMIIEKALTATDMRRDQGRLSLPAKQLRAEFFTAEEIRYFEDRRVVNNKLNYIDTIVVGSDLRENPMQFKKWLLGQRLVDFFINKWNCFSRTYGLRVGNRVRIWSFRVDQRDDENVVKSELRFALIEL